MGRHFSKRDIPAVDIPDGPRARPHLTVAVVLDKFSAIGFRYEWHQIEPTPENWRLLLESERPDLLFVESAWQGNSGAWTGAMSRLNCPTAPLCDLVAWCRSQSIPTVFWNKEDPPNFDLFIETAKLFDYVFSVDADCVPRYREILGHNRVGLLPFGAQPRIHNPVSVRGGRKHSIAFAGTYHVRKYPERKEQMDTLFAAAADLGLDIYSRTVDDPRYGFPNRYAHHIVGSLSYEQMLGAYKAYKVFLNVNSVPRSATTCPRRVFELSACATPVVSGHSDALDTVFGHLVPTCHTSEEARTALVALLSDDSLRERRGHLAMREVFASHTYGHRVDTLLATIGLDAQRSPRSVSVILCTNRPGQLDRALANVARQAYKPLQLVLVLHGFDSPHAVPAAHEAGIDDVALVTADTSLSLGQCLNLGIDAADGDYVAKMDDDDMYGEHYLVDLMNAFTYTNAGLVGKGAHYTFLQARGVTLLRFKHLEHTFSHHVSGATISAERSVLRHLRFADLRRGADTDLLRRATQATIGIYSADRFNFASTRSPDLSQHTWKITEDDMMRKGMLAFEGPPDERVFL